jgi:hypothetical protein
MCQVGLCRETFYRLRIPTPQTRRPAPAESGMGVERCPVLETSRAPQSSPRPAWSVSKHSARGRDTGVGRPASWSREGERTSVWIQMHRSYSFIISLVSVRPLSRSKEPNWLLQCYQQCQSSGSQWFLQLSTVFATRATSGTAALSHYTVAVLQYLAVITSVRRIWTP